MSLAAAAGRQRGVRQHRGALTELDAVLSADGTTVDDTGGISDRLVDALGEPRADDRVHLLSLRDRRDLAGTNGPNGLV